MRSLKSIRSRVFLILFNALITLSCFSAFQVPAEAAILNVPSTQFPTIQSAINAANRGDTIVVEAGRTYTENIVLKYKSTGTGYVTIQSSALASLPAAGNRVGPADASNMPTIRSTSAGSTRVITAPSGSNPVQYYRLIGLNILRHNSTSQQTTLIELGTTHSNIGDVPNNIIIDRCLIRGADNAYTRRGITLNSKDTQIINSYIDNFFEHGADSQAILGWNGTKDVLIANNFLEAGSENILIGGADPSIANFVPNNITIDHNHFFKRLDWKDDSPNKNVKNLLETKNVRDLVVQNNIFENCWAESQDGKGVHFSLRNQDGGAPWSTAENITFRYNILKNVGNGISFLLQDDAQISGVQKNILIENNLVEIVSANNTSQGYAFLFVKGGAQSAENITINHNTLIHLSGSYGYGNRFMMLEGSSLVNGFYINNNIVAGTTENGADIGRISRGGDGGTTALNNGTTGSGWSFNKNVVQRGSAGMPGSSYYVASTTAIGFENYSGRNYLLRSNSPYRAAGTDGKDVGADIPGLNRRVACVPTGQRSNCVGASVRSDFDGDGRSDLSVFRPSDAVWYINRSTDGDSAIRFGLSQDKIAPADFDGDGKVDVAVFRPQEKLWYVLMSSTGSVDVRYFGSNGDVPVPADYDGDGKDDIAVWRPLNGTWYGLKSSDGSFFASPFGLSDDRTAVGDYDGDAMADLAVYRPSTGTWYIQRSTQGFIALRFGLSDDVIVPADFDGDGVTDISVFRPSNGTWYRLNSSNGQFSAFPFGWADDLPAPGDFDGDGKSDVAVFRRSNGVWYLQKSSEGFAAYHYGMDGDQPTFAAFVR